VVEINNDFNAHLSDWAPGSPASAPLPLIAGQRYYIEILNESGQIKSPLSVSWQRPGHSAEIISAEFLAPFSRMKKSQR
jgi:hypothetical protein